jgi:hypothetical protein
MKKIAFLLFLLLVFCFYPSNVLKDIDYKYSTTSSFYNSFNFQINPSLPEFHVKISQIGQQDGELTPYSIDISAEGFKQTITGKSWFVAEKMLEFEDWNFDGYKDLRFDDKGFAKFYLWSGEGFKENEQLENLQKGASFKRQEGLLEVFKILGGGKYQTCWYSYQDGEYRLQKEKLLEYQYPNGFDNMPIEKITWK